MSRLFEPITIHGLTLKKRLVMPPMATAKADEAGGITDAVCAYYQERARYSKIGLIITEHSYVSQQGKAHPGQTSMAEDAAIPGWRRLTDCVHQEGVKIFAQLSHAGTAASSQVTGQTPVGPSALCHPKQQKELPAEMTVRQIQETAQAFGEAARRAREAGFDGVEIHAAHGYLLNQFYSPLANHRTDAYGSQSMENRTRFHREVLQAVRQAAGEDFPVAVRLGGCDYQEGGQHPGRFHCGLPDSGGKRGRPAPPHRRHEWICPSGPSGAGVFPGYVPGRKAGGGDPGSSDWRGHHPGPGGRAPGGGLCRSDRCRPGYLSEPPLGGLISITRHSDQTRAVKVSWKAVGFVPAAFCVFAREKSLRLRTYGLDVPMSKSQSP
mgnify:CR=1 FL=1